MMNIFDNLHERHIRQRRVDVLVAHLASVMPENASVLDVGCGDGQIAASLLALRPDLTVHGVDIMVRPETAIPVTEFDGQVIASDDQSYDIVSFCDVLHHVPEPMPLLNEAVRVAASGLVIKDHYRNGLAAQARLKWMDDVGNRRHGVPVPARYWSRSEWDRCFLELGIEVAARRESLGLYPFPINLVFDSGLHFVARLERNAGK